MRPWCFGPDTLACWSQSPRWLLVAAGGGCAMPRAACCVGCPLHLDAAPGWRRLASAACLLRLVAAACRRCVSLLRPGCVLVPLSAGLPLGVLRVRSSPQGPHGVERGSLVGVERVVGGAPTPLHKSQGFLWCSFARQYVRPFLAPLFAFLALHRPGREVRLPLYVLIVLRWLRDRIRARRSHPLRRRAHLKNSLLRVDAKAEGLTVAVGGWAPYHDDSGNILVDRSSWFSVRLTEANAPWAFVRGLPARAISTLELLATTLGLALLAPPALDAAGSAGTVAVTGLTDSQVAAAVVTRGLTRRSLCALSRWNCPRSWSTVPRNFSLSGFREKLTGKPIG